MPKPVAEVLAKFSRRLRTWLALLMGRRRSSAIVSASKPSRLLVVCYGNIYRSPLAERALAKLMPDTQIRSAGFHSLTGREVPLQQQQVARELGFDLSDHRSACVDEDMLAWAETIVVMDRHNYERLARFEGDVVSRVVWLNAFGEGALEVNDPYGRDIAHVEVVARKVVHAARDLAQALERAHRNCSIRRNSRSLT